jgi:signal transduction histidine kinase
MDFLTPRLGEALQDDLLLASQLRVLSRVYRAGAHDIRGPLNALVLTLDRLQVTLRQSEGTQLVTKAQGYLDVLREEIDRLDGSLQALLAETTPASKEWEDFDLRDTLQEIERLLLARARLQGVTIDLQVPATPVGIHGQRDRLKQSILNIATNGLEAMPDGGALAMILATPAAEAEVRIIDSGVGIADEARQRIFEMHYTTKTTGTGIGLYLAHAIVTAHGGAIGVDSRLGCGSEFRVRLPARRPQE